MAADRLRPFGLRQPNRRTNLGMPICRAECPDADSTPHSGTKMPAKDRHPSVPRAPRMASATSWFRARASATRGAPSTNYEQLSEERCRHPFYPFNRWIRRWMPRTISSRATTSRSFSGVASLLYRPTSFRSPPARCSALASATDSRHAYPNPRPTPEMLKASPAVPYADRHVESEAPLARCAPSSSRPLVRSTSFGESTFDPEPLRVSGRGWGARVGPTRSSFFDWSSSRSRCL